MITKLIQNLCRVWQRCFPSSRRAKPFFCGIQWVNSMAQGDEAIQARKLVVVGTREHPKWLRFLCPCGCEEVVALNLMKSHQPRWAIEPHRDRTLSVSPSIDSRTCRSHYWIRHSHIDWV